MQVYKSANNKTNNMATTRSFGRGIQEVNVSKFLQLKIGAVELEADQRRKTEVIIQRKCLENKEIHFNW